MKNADVRLLFTGASIIEGWRSTAVDMWNNVLEPRGALNLGIPGETSGELLVDAAGETVPALLPDGLHLSPAGYDRWATVLFPLLGIA